MRDLVIETTYRASPVKPGKRHHHLCYEDKTMRIATLRAKKQTPEFKPKYRWRYNIKTTMSGCDRITGVKRLRARVLPVLKYRVRLKAIGVNLFRAIAVRNAWKGQEGPPKRGDPLLYRLMLVVK